jgi:hypothetical protein
VGRRGPRSRVMSGRAGEALSHTKASRYRDKTLVLGEATFECVHVCWCCRVDTPRNDHSEGAEP